MIEFLTLFIGLATGPQTVEVVVGPGVASVELRLGLLADARPAGNFWLGRYNLAENIGEVL